MKRLYILALCAALFAPVAAVSAPLDGSVKDWQYLPVIDKLNNTVTDSVVLFDQTGEAAIGLIKAMTEQPFIMFSSPNGECYMHKSGGAIKFRVNDKVVAVTPAKVSGIYQHAQLYDDKLMHDLSIAKSFIVRVQCIDAVRTYEFNVIKKG